MRGVGYMLVEQDIQKMLHRLADGDSIKIALDGSDIMIRFLNGATKLSLTTSVYYGGNYIPSSVRQCASGPAPFASSFIKTYLQIDEGLFQICLHYLGPAEYLTQSYLKEILEEFGWIAEKWRLYLDEHDKNDLVYVRVK